MADAEYAYVEASEDAKLEHALGIYDVAMRDAIIAAAYTIRTDALKAAKTTHLLGNVSAQ